ncbi:hypothetical protein B9Z55_021299 [Caenorhabditis nigoni]|nr:hypothetical protein B9Z55_021299 [Caenorhabditis nigoni]
MTSEHVIASDCCEKKCVYFLRRLDVLLARYYYVKFYNGLDHAGKRESRYTFLSTLVRSSPDYLHFVPLGEKVHSCPELISRVFGTSVHVLLNAVTDSSSSPPSSRLWYQPTVEHLGSAIMGLSQIVQFNSLNKIMLPPNYSRRITDENSAKIPVAVIRKRMEINIQERKNDSLTRCVSCVSLPKIIEKSKTIEEKNEAKRMLKSHYSAIRLLLFPLQTQGGLYVFSQQRVIVDAVTKMGRSSEHDVSTILMDGMSNKHTKLPVLISRPKKSAKYKNVAFPMIQSTNRHDSSYNVSLLLHGFSKLHRMAATIFIVLDSAKNNKSFVFLGGLGYSMTKIGTIQKIVLLYPSVGHTHMSVDAHFGSLSQSMAGKDIRDPSGKKAFHRSLSTDTKISDFVHFLEAVPSVSSVVVDATIYDFLPIQQHMHTPPGLCSHGVIVLSKCCDGKIKYSSSLTLNATQLLGAETKDIEKPLFKDEFYDSDFWPLIVKPSIDEISPKIRKVVQQSALALDDENEQNFKKFISRYGKQSLRQLIATINSIPSKISLLDTSANDLQLSVLEYLKSKGVKTGIIPQGL